MQAPGFRFNEREANPNPYVGFIRALKGKANHTVSCEAEVILKAVAAQMKKIMEQRFMFVHTLEEAEYNRVVSYEGRNWNYGQSIELVLRGPSGRFYPMPYITSVMCHEMAHIQQMNHGPKFQALMREIKEDVRRMQARGNYGDGFWSDGQRLRDNARMGAGDLRPSDFPDYVCGVSHSDAQRAKRPRRGPASSRGPGLVKGEASHLSGRQTEYRRAAGRRNNVDMGESTGRLDGLREVTAEDRKRRAEEVKARASELHARGMAITSARKKAGEEWDDSNPWFKAGNTFGQTAKSKTSAIKNVRVPKLTLSSAAEARADAAEARLARLNGMIPQVMPDEADEDDLKPDIKPEDDDSDADVPDPHLDSNARRKELEDDAVTKGQNEPGGGWEEFVSCQIPGLQQGDETTPGGPGVKREREQSPPRSRKEVKVESTSVTKPTRTIRTFGAAMVDEEGKRVLGLSGSTLSGTVNRVGTSSGAGWSCTLCTFQNPSSRKQCEMCQASPDGSLPV